MVQIIKASATSTNIVFTGHRNVQNVKAAEEKINSLSQAAGTMKMMCPTGFLFYLEVIMQKFVLFLQQCSPAPPYMYIEDTTSPLYTS